MTIYCTTCGKVLKEKYTETKDFVAYDRSTGKITEDDHYKIVVYKCPGIFSFCSYHPGACAIYLNGKFSHIKDGTYPITQ
jgi:DNA-directed RNA polymerase subunit N (RpoN/RPB10)